MLLIKIKKYNNLEQLSVKGDAFTLKVILNQQIANTSPNQVEVDRSAYPCINFSLGDWCRKRCDEHHSLQGLNPTPRFLIRNEIWHILRLWGQQTPREAQAQDLHPLNLKSARHKRRTE